MDLDERRAYEGVISRAAEIALSDPSAFIELFVRDRRNRPIVQAQLHRDMQRAWTRNPYMVMAVPRGHGKTTQALARVAWEIIRDTNICVQIVAATDDAASRLVPVIRSILEDPAVQRAYPWVRFAPDRSQSQTRFTVVRSARQSGIPTVHGGGILSAKAGGRADLVVCDDPVTVQNAIRQPRSRKMVIQIFFSVFFPMIEPDNAFRLWYTGTTWHNADLLSSLLGGLDAEKKPATFKRVVTEDLVSPWPEYWTVERLKALQGKMPTAEFARGFFLRAIADDDIVCKAGWLQVSHARTSDATSIILGVDPASGKQGRNDYTAVSVLEIHDNFTLLRDVVRFRVPFPEQIGRILKLRNDLRPELVVVEDVGVQNWMQKQLIEQGCPEAVTSDPVKNNKPARFRILGFRHQQGVLRVAAQETVGLNTYRDELLGYPAMEHDDTLDAVALAQKAAENARMIDVERPTQGEAVEGEDRGITAEDIGIYLPHGGTDDDDRDEWAGW